MVRGWVFILHPWLRGLVISLLLSQILTIAPGGVFAKNIYCHTGWACSFESVQTSFLRRTETEELAGYPIDAGCELNGAGGGGSVGGQIHPIHQVGGRLQNPGLVGVTLGNQ